jgi:CRISPR-associated protein Csd2
MSDINRATGLLVLEVVNSNPNGDPDRESDPRQRPNGQGEISPVSYKRKLRDLVEAKDQPVFQSLKERLHLEDGRYEILESRGRDRAAITKEMKDGEDGDFMKSTFVGKYWDARVFGNTFLEGESDKRTIKTGVVQFGMGLSVKPVEVVRHTNTNKAGVQEDKNQGMAPMAYRVVTHAVYCMPFFVNPTYAAKSGCTKTDIDLLKALIPYAYDHTRSAIRPDVRIRHAWYVEHADALGSCPDFRIFDALTPKAKTDNPASWDDYEVPTTLPPDLLAKGLVLSDLAN